VIDRLSHKGVIDASWTDFLNFTRGSDECIPPQDIDLERLRDIDGIRRQKNLNGESLDVPVNDVMFVTAKGCKYRGVTRSHPGLILNSESLRLKMFRVLKNDRRLRQVLKGDREGAIKSMKWYADRFNVSADLTAATDRIFHDLALALWSGVDCLLSLKEKQILRYSLGPQWLRYPDGDTVLSSCGILMGLKLSWVTLNLMHLFWTDSAFSMAGLEPSQSEDCTRICGDDLLGNWPASVVKNYETMVVACNGALSEGKHFVTREKFVFTEIMGETRVFKSV